MSTASASATARADGVTGDAGLRRLVGVLVSVAVPPAVLGVLLLVLFTPLFMHPALDAAGSSRTLAIDPEQVRALSDRTVEELFMGPGTFSFAGPDGSPFYGPDEAAHLRDVRLVLFGFLALTGASLAVLGAALVRRRQRPWPWRAIARGAAGLVVGLLAAGAFALVAFELAFELFHRVFFPGGNWAFDPASQRLVQLYPLAFWQLTAAALGLLGVAAGTLLWLFARRRAVRLEQGLLAGRR